VQHLLRAAAGFWRVLHAGAPPQAVRDRPGAPSRRAGTSCARQRARWGAAAGCARQARGASPARLCLTVARAPSTLVIRLLCSVRVTKQGRKAPAVAHEAKASAQVGAKLKGGHPLRRERCAHSNEHAMGSAASAQAPHPAVSDLEGCAQADRDALANEGIPAQLQCQSASVSAAPC